MVPVIQTKDAVVEDFRRRSIAEAARRVIAHRGLIGASMQAIAGEARVAKGTLYLYFKDRDELLEHAATGAFSELLERLQDVAHAGGPLPELLRTLVRTKVEFFDQNQDFLRVYVETRHQGEVCGAGQRRRSRPQYQRYLELLSSVLRAAMARGEIKKLDPARLAAFLAEGVSAILLRRLSEPGRPAQQDVEWIVDLVLNGIAVPRRAR